MATKLRIEGLGMALLKMWLHLSNNTSFTLRARVILMVLTLNARDSYTLTEDVFM